MIVHLCWVRHLPTCVWWCEPHCYRQHRATHWQLASENVPGAQHGSVVRCVMADEMHTPQRLVEYFKAGELSFRNVVTFNMDEVRYLCCACLCL